MVKINQTFICLISENCAFSINGIEIDLNELEIYEKRLAEKRQKHPISSESIANNDSTELDDLDDYLDKLNIAASSSGGGIGPNEAKDSTVSNDDDDAEQQHDVGVECNESELNHQMPFPLLLYGFMSIIFALSTAYRQSKT